MLENIVNLLLGSSGRFKQLTESALKALFILTIPVWSLPGSNARSLEHLLIEPSSLSLFRLIPDILLILIFYFFYWYLSFVFLPSIETGFMVRMITKGFKPSQTSNAPQQGISFSGGRAERLVRSAFAYFGIFTPNDQPIGLGPIGLLMLPDLVRETVSGETASLLSEITSPFVVIEMVIVYMLHLRSSLSVPPIWTIVLVSFGILVVMVLFTIDLFRFFIRLFQKQMAPFLQQLASASNPRHETKP